MQVHNYERDYIFTKLSFVILLSWSKMSSYVYAVSRIL